MASSSSSFIPTEIPDQPYPAHAASAATITVNYGVALTIALLLLLIFFLTFLSYYCSRSRSRRRRLNPAPSPPPPPAPSSGGGIDDATLSSYPKLLYSKAKLLNASKVDKECCSICLADYRDAETLRMLPDCGHLFHVKCIDAWLRLHPTCPVCRTSPLPTPLSTPCSSAAAASSSSDTLALASRV